MAISHCLGNVFMLAAESSSDHKYKYVLSSERTAGSGRPSQAKYRIHWNKKGVYIIWEGVDGNKLSNLAINGQQCPFLYVVVYQTVL